MKKIKVGLLPLYIKLYDDSAPQLRKNIDAFHAEISRQLKKHGLDVIDAAVCRIRPEFEDAIKKFENEDADAIITLHLAYSPSLESSSLLAATPLPIIVLDTTPDFIYNTATEGDALNYNHGIHGVQDMCNLLRRSGKPYEICAGHWKKSDVIDRVIRAAAAAKIVKSMKNARVGIVGGQFYGMGDFGIPYDTLRSTIGMDVITYDDTVTYAVSDDEIKAEYESDINSYEVKDLPKELYYDVAKVGLGIRKWIAENNLTAFTMNFLKTSASSSFSKMPFCEASKAMAAGIGYAGEGDVMTAALVGALLSVYGETTFTEMFCPDWNGDSVFLSHMGEFNLKCTAGKLKLTRKPFEYTDAGDTTAIIGSFKNGKTLFTCLAPQADNKYSLIIAKGKMLKIDPDKVNLQSDSLNGWFKPKLPIADFLEEYSRCGGIHHAAMVYDGDIEVLKMFGRYMGWNVVVID
jgi:L-arabinose isomerase